MQSRGCRREREGWREREEAEVFPRLVKKVLCDR